MSLLKRLVFVAMPLSMIVCAAARRYQPPLNFDDDDYPRHELHYCVGNKVKDAAPPKVEPICTNDKANIVTRPPKVNPSCVGGNAKCPNGYGAVFHLMGLCQRPHVPKYTGPVTTKYSYAQFESFYLNVTTFNARLNLFRFIISLAKEEPHPALSRADFMRAVDQIYWDLKSDPLCTPTILNELRSAIHLEPKNE